MSQENPHWKHPRRKRRSPPQPETKMKVGQVAKPDALEGLGRVLKEMEAKLSAKSEEGKVLDVVEVRRYPGQRIEVPEGMGYDDAIKVLTRMRDMEEEVVQIVELVRCFPNDGALALSHVLEELYGVIFAERIPPESFFDVEKKPLEKSVEVGFEKTQNVRWGRFRIPGTKNKNHDFFETSVLVEKGLPYFVIVATVRRKFEPLVREIAHRVRERVKHHSIYKGKAFRMKFSPDKVDMFGRSIDPEPELRFLDLSKVHPEEMIFPRELETLIAINLWAPIREPDLVRQLRVPTKRGFLLAGPYGVGKTLLANVTALLATENGWTYVYLPDVSQLSAAILWAKQFGRVVIFGEDLDRLDVERSNTLPNTLDGVDTKDSEIMVVLTTNHLERVPELLLRPGRFDCVLPIEAPDAEAHTRLIEVYGRGMLAPDEDFSEVGAVLARDKVIPAVTREVVERAKLAFIHRAPDKALIGEVSLKAEDLLWSAKTMQAQMALLNRERLPVVVPEVEAAKAQAIRNADLMGERLETRYGWHREEE